MEKRMKVCLVTGATGFIGQHMLAELAAAGRKVLALGKPEEVFCTAVLRDAGIRTAAAFPVSAAAFAKSDVQFCFGDVAHGKFIESVFAAAEKGGMDIEFVLHFAACATIQKAQENGREAWRTNYDGTRNVLAAALRRWQRHDSSFRGFFYASTDKVYGEGSRSSYHESDELRPLSCPYDASKARADELVRSVAGRAVFRRLYIAFAMFTARAIITRAGLFRGRCIACCIPKPLPC